jgi:hypothetical protein
MAKQNINVGTTANDKKGDSLRAAFVKVNANFTELYAALGLTDVTLNLGAFTFTGSTMSTDDSTNIVIDRPITVNGEITVDGDIVPKTNLGASLGTPTKQFKSLYVSNNTIFIGGFPISVDGSGNLVVNNGVGGGEFSNLTVANTFEVEGTLEITKNNREGTVALSVTSSFDTGRLGAGQLVFEGNHPTYGIIPSNDDSYSLGNPAFGWSTVYTHRVDFANGTQQNSAGVEIYDANTSSPYVVFPVITGGDQLQIVGAEVSSISGSLALTSQDNLNIISNGSGAIPGGSKTWTFGDNGSLTIPGDIRSDSNINIEINLSDSTLRRWQFGEDGALTLPPGGTILTSSGLPFVYGITSISSSVATGVYNDASGDYQYGTLSYDYAVNGVTSGGFSIEYSRPLVGGNVDIHVGNTIVNGDLTLSGDIKSDSNINIDINLSDSTLRRWQFGEDGVLTTPGAIEVASATATIRLVDNQIGIVATASQSPHLILKGSDTYGGDVYLYGGTKSGGSLWGGNIILSPETNDGGTYGETFIKKSWRANSDAWKFSRDGVFSLPPGGTLQFPNATVQTTAWAGIPGPYSDDSAAAAAGVAVGYPYHKTGFSGQVFVRLS